MTDLHKRPTWLPADLTISVAVLANLPSEPTPWTEDERRTFNNAIRSIATRLNDGNATPNGGAA